MFSRKAVKVYTISVILGSTTLLLLSCDSAYSNIPSASRAETSIRVQKGTGYAYTLSQISGE